MSLPSVAYFSMEMAIDQSLHTYSGGLGFLSGSHMLSAGHLKLPMVGVTMLWSMGYGDQQINGNDEVEIIYNRREYPFLKDTGIIVDVQIYGRTVKVKAMLLEPETFGTVPVYLLTTDFEGNPEADRQLSHVLYDGDERIRIAQEIILGIGGMRVLKATHSSIHMIHLNEGHALPAAFEMLADYGGDLEKVRQSVVFTTHTPVAAGNETHDVHLLMEAGYFANTGLDMAIRLGGESFSLTVAALRMSRMANGVSQLHGLVANNMWQWVENRCPIVAITNATSLEYWQDSRVKHANSNDDLLRVKHEMKKELFEYIEKTTGKKYDPDILTIVWARRFTEYKRPTSIFRDMGRIEHLLNSNKVQLVFAGKFHPSDHAGRQMFNEVIQIAKHQPKVAILSGPGYELELSGLLKRGSDVWLNTPVRPLEASGTSGMSANMNGSVHLSTFDGWAVEGTYHDINGFIINDTPMQYMDVEDRHKQDYDSMMHILENDIIPMYYDNKPRWSEMMRQAINTAESYFNSDRMAIEYFIRLYQSICI